MEVLGVIAGLPGLIEIVQKTVEVASQLKNWKTLSDEMVILLQQLEGLENTLKGAQDRGASPSISPSQVARFQSSLEKIRNDLTQLNSLLNHCNTINRKSGMRFMRKVKLILSGFDKTTKKHIERIRDTRAELTLALVGQVHQDSSPSRSKTDLLLQLEKTLCPASRDFIPSKLDSTCDWIWSQEQLNIWANISQNDPSDHRQRLFCLYGPKGCGKSVLSSSIANTLQAQDKISTFFSFWAGSESQRKLAGLLRTTLWHLMKYLSAEEISQVTPILMRTSSYDEGSLRDALDFAVRTIKSTVYIIIDGVDEAEKDWNEPEDGSLSIILNLLKAHSNAHVLLCGRESSLSRAIAASSSSLKITQNLLRNDVDTLIEWHLDHSSKSHIALSKDLVRESLQTKSEMMFLWVNLVFKELNRSPSTSAMRAVLNNTPPTLDDEYNRMFESLMKRLGGSSIRPSVIMKTVKRIFSLILAAPEPLTMVELGYAYAAEIPILSAHDYELLTRDGLVEACGDFINESNGHFHFAHASIEEFITRPIDRWSQADSNVSYFQVDRLTSQSQMIDSCFNYIRSMDIGYPIHDKSMQSLPQSYPFFQYSAKFIPVLLVNAMPVITNSVLKDFITSKQCCGLVEYIIHTVEMDSWDLFPHYSCLLYSLRDSSMPRSTLATAVNVELGRREKELGEQDPRYQTWAAIGGMLSSYLTCSDTDYEHQVALTTHMPRLTAQSSMRASPSTVQHIAPYHSATLAKLWPTMSALLYSRLLGSSQSVPLEILPTWVLISWAWKFCLDGKEFHPRAKHMVETALRRVRKSRTFTESVCLLLLGSIDKYDLDEHDRHDIDTCTAYSYYQESLEISQGLPSSPQAEAAIQIALMRISDILLLHKDRENGMVYSRQLEHRVCNNQIIKDDSGWLKHMLYQGSAWARWRVSMLQIHTEALEDYEIIEDSVRLHQFVLDFLTERDWNQMSKILGWRWSMSVILWQSGKFDECWVNLQIMLKYLRSSEGTQLHAEYWLDAVDLLTDCLLAQNKEDEARQRLLEIPVALILPKPEAAQSLGSILLKVGCIDRAFELYKCWGHETLLKDLRNSDWNWFVDEAAVERMSKLGVDAKEELGTTAVIYATSEGNAGVVEFLLAQGAKVEFRHQSWKWSPLTIAAQKGRLSVMKLLLDQGAKHGCQCSDGWMPLTLAASQGHDLVVKLLLDYGADHGCQNSFGNTPLILAAHHGHNLVIKVLLDYGADKNRQNSAGYTPLMVAAREGHDSVVKLFIDSGTDNKSPSPGRWTPLWLAVRNGHDTVVKLLLDHGVDKDSQDKRGRTPLNEAAYSGHDSVVRLILEYGADNNGLGSDGWTHMTVAASEGHVKVVQLLLEYGANKNSRDPRGWSPLELAVAKGHGMVVKLLLDCGADPNDRNKYGHTLMDQARRCGQIDMVRLLLDYGVQSDESDAEGRTSGLEEEEFNTEVNKSDSGAVE